MSDPKNKWKQPPAPPAPMFFGKKERDLVKQVNDELSERIIGQPIAYYPISLEESNFNEVKITIAIRHSVFFDRSGYFVQSIHRPHHNLFLYFVKFFYYA